MRVYGDIIKEICMNVGDTADSVSDLTYYNESKVYFQQAFFSLFSQRHKDSISLVYENDIRSLIKEYPQALSGLEVEIELSVITDCNNVFDIKRISGDKKYFYVDSNGYSQVLLNPDVIPTDKAFWTIKGNKILIYINETLSNSITVSIIYLENPDTSEWIDGFELDYGNIFLNNCIELATSKLRILVGLEQ